MIKLNNRKFVKIEEDYNVRLDAQLLHRPNAATPRDGEREVDTTLLGQEVAKAATRREGECEVDTTLQGQQVAQAAIQGDSKSEIEGMPHTTRQAINEEHLINFLIKKLRSVQDEADSNIHSTQVDRFQEGFRSLTELGQVNFFTALIAENLLEKALRIAPRDLDKLGFSFRTSHSDISEEEKTANQKSALLILNFVSELKSLKSLSLDFRAIGMVTEIDAYDLGMIFVYVSTYRYSGGVISRTFEELKNLLKIDRNLSYNVSFENLTASSTVNAVMGGHSKSLVMVREYLDIEKEYDDKLMLHYEKRVGPERRANLKFDREKLITYLVRKIRQIQNRAIEGEDNSLQIAQFREGVYVIQSEGPLWARSEDWYRFRNILRAQGHLIKALEYVADDWDDST